jgi:hypothetical protein
VPAAIDLQAQMKQAHWNIRAPGFIAIHTLFDNVAGGLGGTAQGTIGCSPPCSKRLYRDTGPTSPSGR